MNTVEPPGSFRLQMFSSGSLAMSAICISREAIDAEDLGNGVTRVSGMLSIGEVNERFGTHIEDDYYNSLGGFVFGRLGRKPEIGDEVRANGHLFRVVELDGLRIDRVEILDSPAESGSVNDAPFEHPSSTED